VYVASSQTLKNEWVIVIMNYHCKSKHIIGTRSVADKMIESTKDYQ